ncbi:MAG: Segregation and condensation protein A [Fimbriimonadaceae bacterium]|nr:Segregation and condensation protein A [Fimbriimonadaceae bacterium]
MATALEVVPSLETVDGSLVGVPAISIECDAFSGSLAAMFVAVRRHKVDLLDVPLAPICSAYFEYLSSVGDLDIDSLAAGIAVLSYLVERKASGLLQSDGPEDEFEEPMEAIEPYIESFAPIMSELYGREELGDQRFFRTVDGAPYEMPYEFASVQIEDLAIALESLLKRAHPDPVPAMGRPRRSLADQMLVVAAAVTHEWRTLDRLVVGDFSRTEAVWWFLALLELIRLRQVAVRSDGDQIQFALEDPS